LEWEVEFPHDDDTGSTSDESTNYGNKYHLPNAYHGATMTPPVPPNSAPTAPAADEDHLRLLSIFHYVLAGFTAFFGSFPCIHLAVGIALLAGAFPPNAHGEAPPRFVGLIFVGVGSMLILVFWTFALLIFLGGRNLTRRRRYTFCLVVACIECLMMPLGTVLGAFTIIVLNRPSVKQLFGLPDRPSIRENP